MYICLSPDAHFDGKLGRDHEDFQPGTAKEKASRNLIGSTCRKTKSFGKKSSRRGFMTRLFAGWKGESFARNATIVF